MRKILASMLAAVTVAGSIVVAPPADARQRGIWPHYGGHGAFFNGPRRFANPGVFRGGNQGWYGNQGWNGNQGWYQGRHRGWYGRNYGWRGYGRPYRYGYSGYPYRYGYSGYPYGYGNYGYDDNDGSDAVVAGIAGLAVGAILGGALSHHRYHAGGSCAARFQSYNPATGTYLGYDGLRHPCP